MENIRYMPREAKKEQRRMRHLKTALFVYNFFVFAFACILLGVSVWMAVYRNYMTSIIGNNLYAASVFIVLSCGAIIFFISFLGCCGAVKEHGFMLFVYFVVLIVIAVFLLIAGILAIVFHIQISDSIKKTMSGSLTDSYGISFESQSNRAITDAWDKAQERLMCCGVETEGWYIYRNSTWFKQFGARDDQQLTYEDMDERPYIPKSCCVKDRGWRYVNLDVCQRWRLGPPGSPAPGAINRAIFYTGCFDAGVNILKANASVLIGLAITVAILLIIGIAISGLILLNIRKKGGEGGRRKR